MTKTEINEAAKQLFAELKDLLPLENYQKLKSLERLFVELRKESTYWKQTWESCQEQLQRLQKAELDHTLSLIKIKEQAIEIEELKKRVELNIMQMINKDNELKLLGSMNKFYGWFSGVIWGLMAFSKDKNEVMRKIIDNENKESSDVIWIAKEIMTSSKLSGERMAEIFSKWEKRHEISCH